MILHVLGCIISCFVLLPISELCFTPKRNARSLSKTLTLRILELSALALRAACSQIAPLASLMYLATFASSLVVSMAYKALTPPLYPSNAHSGLGWAIFWISAVVLGGDIFRLVRQLCSTLTSLRGASSQDRFHALWKSLMKGHRLPKEGVEIYDPQEEERMLPSESQENLAQKVDIERRQPRRNDSASTSGSHSPPRVHFEESDWRRSNSRSMSGELSSPTSTLCNTPRTSTFGELHGNGASVPWKLSPPSSVQGKNERVESWRKYEEPVKQKNKTSILQLFKSFLRYSHVTLARSLLILSFAAAYTGLAIYTGSCRGAYKNACLAHGIKGGIFFWYGLLSFARYLGAYADFGWAWNKRADAGGKGTRGGKSMPSAEFVECFVIFLYGATNTWMERFGAEPGDPYTVKQVQHISIAIMFWFAGLVGMLLESHSVRDLLSLPISLSHPAAVKPSLRRRRSAGNSSGDAAIDSQNLPPSYSFSFNPFPALAIGITGVAMAAHHQDYVYEVQIHELWGNLLAGFSVFRILTYFFLWLRPPSSSILPSRPPTEVMASFCLAAGGFVFMLSSEEVSFVAMRNGFGDFMMILNVTVAVICLVFCGIAGLMIIKALAVRNQKKLIVRETEDDHRVWTEEPRAIQNEMEQVNESLARSAHVIGSP